MGTRFEQGIRAVWGSVTDLVDGMSAHAPLRTAVLRTEESRTKVRGMVAQTIERIEIEYGAGDEAKQLRDQWDFVLSL